MNRDTTITSTRTTTSLFSTRTIDRITYRVTASATTGMLVGASFSTLQGLPLPQTTLSMASSFALASTACFIPERIFYHASFYLVPKIRVGAPELLGNNDNGNGNGNDNIDSKEGSESMSESGDSYFTENTRLFASHGFGGIVGGGISGGLFKGRPLQGMMLMTPMMLGFAFGELKLQKYRMKRIKELRDELER